MYIMVTIFNSSVFHFFILFHYVNESEKILLQFMSEKVLPMFSSKSFAVSSLIFRSLIHFKFVFVYGVGECSNFILLHVAIQFSQHHLLKRLSFLHCIFLLILSRLVDHRCMGFLHSKGNHKQNEKTTHRM